MISGIVKNGRATVNIIFRLTNKPDFTIEFVIDTGFTDAEGYTWRIIEWSAWCCIYPAQDFSIQQYFDNAQWISHAAGIEVRFYDDLENMLAKYLVDQGQYIAVI
ncbi:MAG: hypothetical protein V7L11_24040 [Nostoc sp.]|uniref:hypothetical protein n=1 Tax=Nostoc sp. TaxID=1180 RepID=UPI002FF740A9